jgi:molecular chaperone GrpE
MANSAKTALFYQQGPEILFREMQMDEQEKEQNSETESQDFQVIDKRQFMNLDNIDKETLPEGKPRYPTYVEELMERVAETERKFREKKQQIDEEISRTKARLEADLDRRLGLEKQKILLPFIEILDNLQRALDSASKTGEVEHLLEGVQMTANLFLAKLQAAGVEPIPVSDQPFDPNVAEAVGTVAVTEPSQDGTVVEELQTGYLMDDQLLRPAQVKVGRLEKQ